MTLLCVGDVHIKPGNIHLIDGLETQLVEIVQREAIDLVILLGDILDTFERIHTQALNRAYQLIRTLRSKCLVVVLVGNHDLINNQQFLTDQHWMNAMKDWDRVTIVDQVYSTTVRDMQLVFVPYVPVQRFVEALDTLPSWRTADYIFAHQEFLGCKMGAVQSTHGDSWPEEYPMIVSGHIHDTQRPQTNLFYIGASIQNSFGDQADPRVLCIRGKCESEWSEIPIQLPKKKTVYVGVDEIHTLDTTVWEQDPLIDSVRIVVRGDYEQFKTLTKSTAFEELTANQKCKVVHKPLAAVVVDPASENAESTGGSQNPQGQTMTIREAEYGSFEALLTRKVLLRRDEWLYASFQRVVHDVEHIDPDNILIV